MRPPRRRGSSRLPRGLHEAKRADGSTYFYTRVCVDGEDRRIVHDTDNLHEACARHHTLQARGVSVKSGALVADAWRRWVELDIGTRWAARGRRLVEVRFETHVDPLLGRRRVSELTGDDSRRLAKRLAASGLAPLTQAHVLTHWSRFGRWLEGEGYTHRSPVPSGLRPRVQVKPPDPLTDEEVAKVVDPALVGEVHAFVNRLNRATGLRWSDLVRVQASDLKPDGWLVLTCSKTGKVLRVPLGGMDPDLAGEIRGRVGRLVPFAKASAGTFNRVVQRRSGVERFSTYRLRDTFACGWLNRGGSLTDLQRVLGHADPTTTMRYGRPSDARIMSEAKRIGTAARVVREAQR